MFIESTMAAAGAQQLILDDGRPQAGAHPLEAFFGPLPPGMMPTHASDAYPHESWALPFAYQGRNLFLASILVSPRVPASLPAKHQRLSFMSNPSPAPHSFPCRTFLSRATTTSTARRYVRGSRQTKFTCNGRRSSSTRPWRTMSRNLACRALLRRNRPPSPTASVAEASHSSLNTDFSRRLWGGKII